MQSFDNSFDSISFDSSPASHARIDPQLPLWSQTPCAADSSVWKPFPLTQCVSYSLQVSPVLFHIENLEGLAHQHSASLRSPKLHGHKPHGSCPAKERGIKKMLYDSSTTVWHQSAIQDFFPLNILECFQHLSGNLRPSPVYLPGKAVCRHQSDRSAGPHGSMNPWIHDSKIEINQFQFSQ